jgi:hypothetical protein
MVLAGGRYLSERMPRAAALVVLLACGAAVAQRFMDLIRRGPLAVKGRGELQRSFVDRLQATRCADAKRRSPHADLLPYHAGHLANAST